MLGLYLFALVLGGGFMVLSLLGGEGAEADVDMGGLELGADDFGELGGDPVELSGDAGADAAGAKIFSVRGLIYTLFGFGATGALLTWAGVSAPIALGSAAVGGLTSGALITTVFHWLARTDSGRHPGDSSLIGSMGRVTLPVTAGSAGTVVVARGGREITLRALPHGSGEGDPESWTRVVVVELDGTGVALVAPLRDQELIGGE